MKRLFCLILFTSLLSAPRRNSDIGAASDQGPRPSMEDKFVSYQDDNLEIYFVCDGHGGKEAAQYVSKHLLYNILHNIQNEEIEGLTKAIKTGFELTENGINKAKINSGSTTNLVMIKDDLLIVANLGDSRSILYSSTEGVVPLSVDHKPDSKLEQERIERIGGQVITDSHGTKRTGSLSLSRAFGDRRYKSPMVQKLLKSIHEDEDLISSEPEIKYRHIKPDDQFIIIACDGVWDVLENPEAINIVRTAFSRGADAELAANILKQKALELRTSDNVTAIVIDLFKRNREEEEWYEHPRVTHTITAAFGAALVWGAAESCSIQ